MRVLEYIVENKSEYDVIMKYGWEQRHNVEVQKMIGVWRWLGMYENRDRLLKIVNDNDILKYDIGGALGPLGFGSEIIDREDFDIMGYEIKIKKISSIENPVDLFFMSHFLEHIKEPAYILAECYKKLRSGGKIIIHGPSINGAEYWHPSIKEEHFWIFDIMNPKKRERWAGDYKDVIVLDMVLSSLGFEIEYADYCGDCSLLIIANK